MHKIDTGRRPRRLPRGLSAWTLKLWSVSAAVAIFLGSLGYASAHPYNASAPLQPTIASAVAPPSSTTSRATTTTTSRQGVSSFPSVTTTTRAAVTRSQSS